MGAEMGHCSRLPELGTTGGPLLRRRGRVFRALLEWSAAALGQPQLGTARGHSTTALLGCRNGPYDGDVVGSRCRCRRVERWPDRCS
ncbi:MAG: hypothetical protein RQ760_17810 [Sedimentisphaerales bacterium]|nr:hypothetical protein [Sedimentisphaerales bacterium]